jgi:hypothetical protein
VPAHADGAAINEHQQRVPEIVLLDRLPPEEILAEESLALAVVSEDDAFVLAIVVGRVLFPLNRLAEQINPDGEPFAVDVRHEGVEPFDVMPFRIFAILFQRIDQAGHRRAVASSVPCIIPALAMPRTILSLHKGNKNSVPFVQGKFNMGGSGVLEFCGTNHNVELVLSKRNPKLLPADHQPLDEHWSFTVIRREDPGPLSPRASRFTYLAPGKADADGNRSLLSFAAPQLPIFPVRNQPYAREAEWGTLFKLYDYNIRAATSMMMDGGLMGRVRVLLPEPALPIRFNVRRCCFSAGRWPSR